MEPAQHIAFLSAQLAQTKASLRYQTACAEAAERRLRAFERTRVGGFMGPTSTCEGSHIANQTPLKSCTSHHTYGSPRSFFSENASTQPYDSPSRSCVVPQNPCSREVHALRELRQDAEDVENLQRELELHTTISPDFLAELQLLWRNYTEATDEVISVAISKAQEEGVRQALEGLRRELRQGSVYPTYELARSGSSSKSPCLPVCPPILTTPSEANTASQSSTIITHSPRNNARSLSLATHSDRRSNWPQSLASSDDDSCEECDAKWEAQSVHVSPLFLVERKAAEAAAAVRACRPQAISEPDIDQAAPLIASSRADCKVFKKSGQQECVGYRGSGQKEYEAPGESGQDSHRFQSLTLCGSSPYHQDQLQSVREHRNVKEQQQGSEAAQPNAPACVQSNCWLAHFEDIPDAAAPETPTRSSCPSQAAKQATWAHPFAQQQQRDPQHSDTQTACPTMPFTTALPPESDALHYSDTTAACPTVPCATATPQPHTPRPGHHQLPSFSAFLSPADTAQPDRLTTPVAPVCHTKACQTEYCFWPEALALDELIQGKDRALHHTEAQIDAGSPRKLDLPSLADKHTQPTSSEHRSSRATESAVVGQQQPLQGQLQLAAPNELVQQPEGSAHMHHHLQHLLAVLHKGAQMLPEQQQQGCTPVKEQPQQQPQLSSPVMRQLMDFKGCKELQIRSQLVSALLSGVLHLRISNTSPNTQAAASAADAAGAAPPRHHLTQRLHHGYARASTFPLPGELLQVRGLGSSGSGVRARAKEGATVCATANTGAAKTPHAATATAGSDAANTARHGSKGEVPHAGDGCQQQDMSRLLGVVAALHHLHAPRPGLGDQTQRCLSRVVEIGQQAFWSQERRQRTSSFGHQATNRRLMLYETHS